jgi:hypothetical protein
MRRRVLWRRSHSQLELLGRELPLLLLQQRLRRGHGAPGIFLGHGVQQHAGQRNYSEP